jgi:hypothetical protein
MIEYKFENNREQLLSYVNVLHTMFDYNFTKDFTIFYNTVKYRRFIKFLSTSNGITVKSNISQIASNNSFTAETEIYKNQRIYDRTIVEYTFEYRTCKDGDIIHRLEFLKMVINNEKEIHVITYTTCENVYKLSLKDFKDFIVALTEKHLKEI